MAIQDLEAAARAARYLASAACAIHAMIEAGEGNKPAKLLIPKPVPGDESTYTLMEAGRCESPVKHLLDDLNQQLPEACEAIRAVATELRLTRTSVFRCGDVVATTAHEAAMKMVYLLNGQWFGVEAIGRKQMEAWPDADEVIAEIELELTKVRCSREQAKPFGQSPPRAEIGGQPAEQPIETPRPSETGNVLHLTGTVWHVRYEENDEAGDFPDRKDSVLRHLARLLAEPYRRFGALEFYPPQPGAAELPYLGRDESSDEQASKEYEKEMRRLAQEIKEAEDAHDAETAATLKEEFDALFKHLGGEKGAKKWRHKKRCGTSAPVEKADQTLRMGLCNLSERFRKVGLPKLADHLDKCIDNSGCQWWYAPLPGTSPWHVIRPDPHPER
jgi:hypothetical protein